MRESFVETVEKNDLVRPGDRVLVAVSGGCDSVVLLDLFLEAAGALSCRVSAAHLDHGIRPESGGDAEFVRRICRQRGVPFFHGRADVPALARERGLGLEETARDERRRFLRETARENSCDVIALGHHRDDQVETFLHRLLRGSGATGLAAMRRRSGVFVRPLLDFSPEQITEYVQRRRLDFVEDASNFDLRFTRNRIRQRVLPVLREIQPAVDRTVARLCDQLALEADFWGRCEQEALRGLLVAETGDELRLDRAGLAELHPALRPRVLRSALELVRGDLQGIDAAHVERIEELAASGVAQQEAHLPRAWAACRYDRLLLRRQAPAPPSDYSVTLDAPGSWSLPGGGRVDVRLEEEVDEPGDPRTALFCADLPFPLQVRNLRAGDRIALPKVGGRKKVKDLFIDAKVEKDLRRALPMLACGDEILWIPGFRRSRRYRPHADAPKVLKVEFSGCPALDNWLVNSSGL